MNKRDAKIIALEIAIHAITKERYSPSNITLDSYPDDSCYEEPNRGKIDRELDVILGGLQKRLERLLERG